MAYFHRYSAAARCVFPCAAEHFNGEHMLGGQNAVARQDFCPLQRFEFVIFFMGLRGRSGIPAQESSTNSRTGFFLATRRTEPLLSRSPCDLAATACADYRRITPRSSDRASALARRAELDYYGHV
jgi:hypothetical protein